VCKAKAVVFDKDGFSYLVDKYYRKANRPLRSCHPRDLVEQITTIARYNEEEPSLTTSYIDQACRNYFVQGAGNGPERS